MTRRELRTIVPGFDAHLVRAAESVAAHGWIVIEHFTTLEFARRMRQEAVGLLDRGNFRSAGVGRGSRHEVRSSVRGDSVHWIDPVRATGAPAQWLQIAEMLRSVLNERLLLGLFDYEAHLALYPPRSSYARHRDHFVGSTERVLTTTFYLNEDWLPADGGALRIFVEGEEFVDVSPRAGTLVLFLSQDFEHEVCAARRDRWSVTGWFRRRG